MNLDLGPDFETRIWRPKYNMHNKGKLLLQHRLDWKLPTAYSWEGSIAVMDTDRKQETSFQNILANIAKTVFLPVKVMVGVKLQVNSKMLIFAGIKKYIIKFYDAPITKRLAWRLAEDDVEQNILSASWITQKIKSKNIFSFVSSQTLVFFVNVYIHSFKL